MTEHLALTTESRRPVTDFRNSLQKRKRALAHLAHTEGSVAYRVPTDTSNLTRHGKTTAHSELGRQIEAFLKSAVGPVVVVAAAALLAIMLSLPPAGDGLAALEGPLSGHSLLHFPR